MSKGREFTRYPEVDPSFPEDAPAWRAVLRLWYYPATVLNDHHGSSASRQSPQRAAGAPGRSSRSRERYPASLVSLARAATPSQPAVADPRRSCVGDRLPAVGHGRHIYAVEAFVSPEPSRDGSARVEA